MCLYVPSYIGTSVLLRQRGNHPAPVVTNTRDASLMDLIPYTKLARAEREDVVCEPTCP